MLTAICAYILFSDGLPWSLRPCATQQQGMTGVYDDNKGGEAEKSGG